MTLSTFVNITSKLFYGLMGVRNIIMFIAVMIYVDMVLSTNSFQNSFLERLRTLYLRLLFIPLALTFGVFIYQGYMSDNFHYVDNSKRAEATFNIITAVGIITWQLCFVLLLIFVILARRTFSRYLIDVILPEIEKERASAGWHSQSGGDSDGPSASKGSGNGLSNQNRKFSSGLPSSSWDGSSGKKFRSKSTAIAAALQSGITTLRWIGLGVMLFIMYSVFFAAAVLYIGTPNIVYFFTLFVNWCTPFFFGLIIFIVVFFRTINQIRDLDEKIKDVEVIDLSNTAASPYSLVSHGSAVGTASIPLGNPIQAFYTPNIEGFSSELDRQPVLMINPGFRPDRRLSNVDLELSGFTTAPPVNSPTRQDSVRYKR
ncbi:hypothetical protein HDU67_005481 [Dinochytrium kinnereticum]|nr:hypothetical protein HDU67_005481 [Dinochytrium kinnereticum]